MKQEYDLIVIGGGSAGVRAARWSAGLGARVAIVEKERFGGTCVLKGCVPKKIMVIASHFAQELEAYKNYGWSASSPRFSWETLRKNREAETERLSEIYHDLLIQKGVEIFSGEARFVGEREIEVKGERLKAKHLLIATGGHPAVPNIPGREHLLTSDDFFKEEHQARSIALIGAGYIGVELAGVYHGLGSETHLIGKSHIVLPRFDHEAASFLTERLRLKGMHLHLGCEVKAVHKEKHGLRVEMRSGEDIAVEKVFVSTGRRPNTQGLNLEAVGIECRSDGRVSVDENMQTSMPGVYALGDVANTLNLTPVATAEGMWISEYLFGKKPEAPFDDRLVPTAVFSNPEVASVGWTEEHCQSRGKTYTCFKTRFRPLKHSISKLEERTFMKLLVEKESDRILGCHIVGEGAGEILQGFAVAIKMGATKKDFDLTLGIHPTSAEEMVTLRG
jgi:glutathione reductase (NADPH)